MLYFMNKYSNGRYWYVWLAAFAACAMLLSSCSILLKERQVAGNGLETKDFGLPVIIYKSLIPFSTKMVVLLSGDGGWLDFNNNLSVHFALNGYHVIGFNSRTYFWEQRSPEETAEDLILLLRKYNALWKVDKIVLSGYSFGADVIPFVYNRLPEDLKNKVVCLQLLSPFLSTDFVVHTSDLLNIGGDDRYYKVEPEIEKTDVPVYCFYGRDETYTALLNVKTSNFFLDFLPGGHRYNNAYRKIVSTVKNKERPLRTRR